MAGILLVALVAVALPLGLLVVGIVSLVRRALYSVPGAQGVDASDLRKYVHTFARTLSTLGVSRGARRRHVEELKANLADAVAADGVASALAGLGPAGALATGYADYRPRPAWLVGLGAALLTFAMATFVHAQYANAYAAGWADALGATAGEGIGGHTRIDSWGVLFEATLNGSPHVEATAMSPWLWILPIAAFVIASRSWRALALRNAATVKA